MIGASLPEPIMQMGLEGSKQPCSWLAVYIGFHVLVFNAVQMSIWRRYDFVSVYTMRLFYYLQCHIVWGSVRLHVLF